MVAAVGISASACGFEGESTLLLFLVFWPIGWLLWQVIVFAFSKKECEALATNLQKLDFNNDDERATAINNSRHTYGVVTQVACNAYVTTPTTDIGLALAPTTDT